MGPMPPSKVVSTFWLSGMRAVFFLGDQRAEVREAPDPIPSGGQVLVALRASTICGSDLHMYS